MEVNKKSRPKKRNMLLVLLSLLILYVIGEYTVPRFPFGPYSLYGDLTEQELAEKIPYQSLTDESSYPFLSVNFKRNHEDAIRRFTTVRDCLVISEAQKDVPDLRLIDWDAISDLEEADVCVWRIFSSLGSPDLALEWLKFHNAQNARKNHLAGNYPNITEISDNYKNDDSYTIVAGNWEMSRAGIRFPTKGWHALRAERFRRGNGVNAIWAENSDLLSVNWEWQPVL